MPEITVRPDELEAVRPDALDATGTITVKADELDAVRPDQLDLGSRVDPNVKAIADRLFEQLQTEERQIPVFNRMNPEAPEATAAQNLREGTPITVNVDPAKAGPVGRLALTPATGTMKALRGVDEIANRDFARGGADIVLGAGEALTPTMLGLGAGAPLDAVAWYAMSHGLSGLGTELAKRNGMTDEDADRVGGLAGLGPLLYGGYDILANHASGLIDAHNARAEAALRAEQKLGQQMSTTAEGQLLGEQIVGPDGITLPGTDGWKVLSGGSTKTGRPGYSVVDKTGNTLHGPTDAPTVQDWLASQGVERSPVPEKVAEAIVEQLKQEAKQNSAARKQAALEYARQNPGASVDEVRTHFGLGQRTAQRILDFVGGERNAQAQAPQQEPAAPAPEAAEPPVHTANWLPDWEPGADPYRDSIPEAPEPLVRSPHEYEKPGALSPQEDPAYADAVNLARELGRISTAAIQRRLKLGYGRATSIVERMQREGIIATSRTAEPGGFSAFPVLTPDAGQTDQTDQTPAAVETSTDETIAVHPDEVTPAEAKAEKPTPKTLTSADLHETYYGPDIIPPKAGDLSQRQKNNLIKRTDAFLLAHAKRTVKDPYQRRILDAINLDNMAPADRSTIKDLLGLEDDAVVDWSKGEPRIVASDKKDNAESEESESSTAGDEAQPQAEPDEFQRPPFGEVQKEITERYKYWPKPENMAPGVLEPKARPSDPKLGDVFPNGNTQKVLVHLWRTATAKEADGKLHVTFLHPKHPAEPERGFVRLGQEKLPPGGSIGNVFTERGLPIPEHKYEAPPKPEIETAATASDWSKEASDKKDNAKPDVSESSTAAAREDEAEPEAKQPHEMKFAEWRKDPRANTVPGNSIFAADPDEPGFWDRLRDEKKPTMKAMAELIGAPTSGNKDTIIERSKNAWELRGLLADATVESLVEGNKGPQLRELAKRAGVWASGNKTQLAIALIGWRDKTRLNSQKTLAMWKWTLAIERAQENGIEIPEDVRSDYERLTKSKLQLEMEIEEQMAAAARHEDEAEAEAPSADPVVSALENIQQAINDLKDQIITPAKDNTSSGEESTIEDDHADDSARSTDSESLEEQLPEASGGTRTGGRTRSGGGSGRGSGKLRKRSGDAERDELDASGGASGRGVGQSPERLESDVTDNLPPRSEDQPGDKFAQDYRIPDGRVISGSPEARARYNLDAIRTLRTLEKENRAATVAEQETLAKYVGWGAVPQLFAGNSADWKALQDELRSLVSEDEYNDAQRSTVNAHYTGDEQVDAIWQAVLHLGAKPGMSWLEPAIGVGTFFGRQPAQLLAGARRVGMDKDALTSQIAKYLYPGSYIDSKAFEESELPHDYFDGVLSNVPFANFGVHDPQWKTKKHLTGSIHNYFFAKALQLVRPGGIVAFITSRYTMDGHDKTAFQFREYIQSQSDFLGAVRLPTNAFMQSSGTHVITDIIFLRKRLPGAEPAGQAWQASTFKKMPSRVWGGDTSIAVNEYYHAHPDHVLGEEETNRGQFSQNDYTVKGKVTGPEVAEKLKAILPADAFERYTPEKKKPRKAITELKAATAETAKLGALFFDDAGNLFRKTSKGTAEPLEVNKGLKARIKGQLQIRNVLLQLVEGETSDKPEAVLNDLRKALNRVYDGYVREHGPLSSRTNQAAVKGDPDAPWLVTLERNYNGKTAEKAPIFSRRMLAADVPATKADNAKDALYVVLNEKSSIDWDRMAALTGKTVEELQEALSRDGLVYQDPKSRVWQTEDEYLSGAVRTKLREAQQYAKLEPQFQANVKALEAVQPEDIPPSEISAALGVTWVPVEIYSEFAQHVLNTRNNIKVAHVGNEWIVEGYAGNESKWSTGRVEAQKIFTDTINFRRTKVYDKDADGSHLNPTETTAAQNKQREMQKEFERWMFADAARGERMARLYNDLNNDLRQRVFNGQHLTLPGMTRDLAVVRGGNLDPHQLGAIWHQIVQPNVLLAHSPGAGKTFEMIAAAMELKRLGLVRRPMFVVPNSTLTGWQIQFTALYPKARVLVFSETDLEAKKRKEVMAQIATGDYDAVVVPHSSFGLLPTGDDIFEEHYAKLAADLEKNIRDAEDAQMGTRFIKQMEKAKERLLTGLRDRRNQSRQDSTVTWEQLGIDQLFVDEAHEYKKLGFTTKQNGIAGIDQNSNQKTFDLLMKIRYTQKFGRGVVFATGTPVTNTMGELFNLMKYLIEPEMEARGMGQFDDWSSQFARTVPVFEPKIGRGYQLKNRFAEFVNLPELSQLFRTFADVVTMDQLDIPRPKLKGGERQAVITELNEDQEAYTESLIKRGERIKADPRKAMPDNMLAVYTDAQKMALDARMVIENAADDPDGRLSTVAKKVYDIWKETQANRSTQLIFADLGKPASERAKTKRKHLTDAQIAKRAEKGLLPPTNFSVYDELIRKLVRSGIPENEIATIYSAKNKLQRTKLFHAVNQGQIRILIGSTGKMGVGVNVQNKVIAMHHLDVPHRPDQLEQREARGWRQGNENPEVAIYYYVTRRSLDEKKFGNVLRKAKFIWQLLEGKSGVRKMEDVEGMVPSLEMLMAASSGDPRVLEKVEVDAKIHELSALKRAFTDSKWKDRSYLGTYQRQLETAERDEQRIQKSIELRDKTGRVWVIQGKKFEGEGIRNEVAAALEAIKLDDLSADTWEVIGSAWGFKLEISKRREMALRGEQAVLVDQRMLRLRLPGNKATDSVTGDMGVGLVSRIENEIKGFEEALNRHRRWFEDTKRDVATLEEKLNEKWPYQKELDAALVKQKELETALGGGDKQDDSLAAFDDDEEIADETVADEGEDEAEEEEGDGIERSEGERGSLRLAPEDIQKLREFFRGKDGEPERNYSGLGALKSKIVRNLSQLEEVSPEAHAAAVKAATSTVQASVLMRSSWRNVDDALAGKISGDEFRRGLIESRLRGIRERWQQLADATKLVAPADLLDWVLSGPIQVLDAMSPDVEPGEPGTLAQQAASLAENLQLLPKAKWNRAATSRLRNLVAGAFEDAADSVHEMMTDQGFQDLTGKPEFQKALGVYKRQVETPLAKSHAENEGVFSTALGPLQTYYPLAPIRAQDEAAAVMGARRGFKRPGNIMNHFATGLADDYDSGLEAFREKVEAAIRVNDKAALIDTLAAEGIVRKLAPGETSDSIRFRGRDFRAIVASAGPARVIVQPDGKIIRVAEQRVAIPEPFYHELKPILEPDRRLPGGFLQRILGLFTQLTLKGPADFAYHAHNLIGVLTGNTPYLGLDLASKTIGNTPVTKILTALVKLVSVDPLDEHATRDLRAMAQLGILPEKFGTETYSKRYAEATGAKHINPWMAWWNMSPTLYGPKGIDVRARLVMYRLAKEINPGASSVEIYKFVNQLGNYTQALQAHFERAAKRTGLSPFYTAGSTMLRNGLDTIIGSGSGAGPGGGAKNRLLQQVSGGLLGMALLWIVVHKAVTGKWPWEDKRAKFGKVPAPAAVRSSAIGKALWGHDTQKTGYINLFALSPHVSRGARAIGLDQAISTAAQGGNWKQAAEGAKRDVANSLIHPLAGPLVRTGMLGFTGKQPYLVSDTDRGGSQFLNGLPKKAPIGSEIFAAAKQLNSFYGNVGAATGLFPSEDKRATFGEKMVKAVTDMSGVNGGATNVNAAHEALRRERRSHK